MTEQGSYNDASLGGSTTISSLDLDGLTYYPPMAEAHINLNGPQKGEKSQEKRLCMHWQSLSQSSQGILIASFICSSNLWGQSLAWKSLLACSFTRYSRPFNVGPSFIYSPLIRQFFTMVCDWKSGFRVSKGRDTDGIIVLTTWVSRALNDEPDAMLSFLTVQVGCLYFSNSVQRAKTSVKKISGMK